MENNEHITAGSPGEDPRKNDDSLKTNNPEETPVESRSLYRDILNDREVMRILRSVFALIALVVTLLAVTGFTLYLVPVLQESGGSGKTSTGADSSPAKDQNFKKQVSLLSRDVQRLSRKYSLYTPGQSYIVINTTDNRFYLYKNKKLIREGFCSSGSYTLLKTAGERKWVFKTPKGKYWIRGKVTKPVWRRPDWSFVEEGLPVPSQNDPSRWEYGVLGDYALSLGDGYLIHGTIYKRFLGMPVTHGCVRLNDDDLSVIYHTLSVGSKVYIF